MAIVTTLVTAPILRRTALPAASPDEEADYTASLVRP